MPAADIEAAPTSKNSLWIYVFFLGVGALAIALRAPRALFEGALAGRGLQRSHGPPPPHGDARKTERRCHTTALLRHSGTLGPALRARGGRGEGPLRRLLDWRYCADGVVVLPVFLASDRVDRDADAGLHPDAYLLRARSEDVFAVGSVGHRARLFRPGISDARIPAGFDARRVLQSVDALDPQHRSVVRDRRERGLPVTL